MAPHLEQAAESWRRLLPKSLVDLEPIAAHDSWELWRARDSDLNVDREVVVLRIGRHWTDDWNQQLCQRLRKLSQKPLLHIVRPISFGIDEAKQWAVLVREIPPGTSMAESDKWHRGEGEAKVARLLRQLLEGLHVLHSEEIVHGDVRPGNIYVSDWNVDRPTLWLAAADTALLPLWSAGEVALDDDRCVFYPKVVQGPVDPSEADDCRAAGLIASKLVLGGDFDLTAKLRKDGSNTDGAGTCVRKALDEDPLRRCSRRMKRIISDLVDSSPGCSDSVRETLDGLASSSCPQRQWASGASKAVRDLVVVAIAFVALGLWFGARESVEKLQPATASQESVASLRTENQLAGVAKQISDLQSVVLALPKPGPDPTAKWRKVWAENSQEILKQLREPGVIIPKRAEEIRQEAPSDAREEIENWIAKLPKDDPKEIARLWLWGDRVCDDELQIRLEALVKAPWETGRAPAFNSRAKDLVLAAQIWQTWVDDHELTMDEVGSNANLASPANVREILLAWLQPFNSSSHPWRIEFSKGASPNGWYDQRLITLSGVKPGRNSGWHAWKDSDPKADGIQHLYGATPVVFDFTWPKGATATLYLENDTIWGLNNMVKHDIARPIDLWKWDRGGGLKQGDVTLWFRIPFCPGPPEQWAPKLPLLPASQVAGAKAK